MEALALVILIVFSVIGFAAVFFTTFGTLIVMVGAVLYGFMTGFTALTFRVLVVLGVLYLIGEGVEYFAVIFGAKRFGASNAAIAGAIFGGVGGAAIGAAFFGLGLVAGAFLGIFMGAFLVELALKKGLTRSFKAGMGSVIGRVGSVAVKAIIAIAMFAIMAASIAGNAG